MPEQTTIAAFAGSLRKGSFNRLLLNAAIELAPSDVRIDRIDIDDLPLFNADLEDDENPIPPVKRLWDAIRAADALLIVSPEYNYSIPAVTKNVIDWASRADDVLDGKVAAVIGASPGMFGTVRMQMTIRQAGLGAGLAFIVEPQIMVTRAKEKFDAAGKLTDERVRAEIPLLLTALADAARRAKS
jgi:chromate reductase